MPGAAINFKLFSSHEDGASALKDQIKPDAAQYYAFRPLRRKMFNGLGRRFRSGMADLSVSFEHQIGVRVGPQGGRRQRRQARRQKDPTGWVAADQG